MDDEKVVAIFKVLSNEARLNILKLLKEPEENFRPQIHLHRGDDFYGGICVGDIRKKTGLVQSTTSQYLALLEAGGLLEKRRIGQWTYYRRNEETIEKLEKYVGCRL